MTDGSRGPLQRWKWYAAGVGFSAVAVGAAAGSLRWAQTVMVLGAVAPFAVAAWWRLLPVVADRPGRVGDVAAFWHARHSWTELAQQLGLALVDPRHARRLVPVGTGAANAGAGLVIDPGEAGWIVPRLWFRRHRPWFRPGGWVATGRLPGGLTPEDFAVRVGSLVHAWRANSIRVGLGAGPKPEPLTPRSAVGCVVTRPG